jgi:hypothetical protein
MPVQTFDDGIASLEGVCLELLHERFFLHELVSQVL